MHKRLLSKRSLFGSACMSALLVAGVAHAQNATPVSLGPSPLQQYAQEAADNGITFVSRYNGEFAANPSGGERQGADFTGELNLGADFDLAKLVGLQGGYLHVLFTDRAGNNLAAKAINNSVSVQQIYGNGQTYQLTYLTYEQKLFNDRVDVELGRTQIAGDFIVSPFYCDFQSNAACGNPSFLGKDINIGPSYYPISVWGGRVQVNITPNVYVKAGLYQNDPAINPDRNHGFDWSSAGSDGVQAAGEIGYTFKAPGAAEPNQYDVGGEFDRAHYSAPYYSPSTQYGRAVVYAQAQQMLYQPIANSPEGLYAFAVGIVSTTSGTQPSNFSAEAGAVYQGIIPSRPLDYAGAMINEVHYNNRFLNYYYAKRLAEGGTQRPNNNLIMMELNYTAQLNSWLNVTPNLQYIVNPDGLGGLAYPRSNLNNAFVVGLQFQLDVANLLGVAVKPTPAVAPVMAQPAPMAAPAPAPSHTYLVFFDWDKANLTTRATQVVAQAASDSRSANLTTINVSGYTDTSGTAQYNMGLSERRAQAVASQLVADGVAKSEIEIHAYGETHLLVPTGPGVREPQNRRVEIVVQ
jgi:porin